MTKVVTPSEITAGQIGKFQELLGARLRKSGLPSEAVQQVLASGDVVASEMLAVIRMRVEAISDVVVRRAHVNRNRTPHEALTATERNLYVTDRVVNEMPRGEGDETEVHFFSVGRWINDDDLEKEYAKRGLVPTDPYSLAAVNEANPTFADERPNCTHWKDASGKWCYAAFGRWRGERSVRVDQDDDGWYGYWWFAGLRK